MKKVKQLLTATAITALALVPALPGIASAELVPVINAYPVPENNVDPMGITYGPDGAAWFTTGLSSYVERVTTSGVTNVYPLPENIGEPSSITTGPDGALWFTEGRISKVGRMTTAGNLTEYTIPTPLGAPYAPSPSNIIPGPDGALWFTDSSDNFIGQISTSGDVTEYPLTEPSGNLTNLTIGPDGALWFAYSGAWPTYGANYVGRMATDGTLTQYTLPSEVAASSITSGPDGALWFSEGYSIGRMATDGTVTAQYSVPVGVSEIITGSDGTMWFSAGKNSPDYPNADGYIGQITTSGVSTLYPITLSRDAVFPATARIAAGPGSTVWFSELVNSGVPSRGFVGQFSLVNRPDAPTSLTGLNPTKQAPALSWSAVTGATSYNIYRDGTKVGSAASTNFTDPAATEGTHSYYVTAVDSDGESAASNTISVLLDKTKPVVSFTAPSSFTGPFVAGPVVGISASDSGSGLGLMAIHVYNSSNQLLTTCGSATPADLAAGSMSCDTSGLAPGTYYIKAGATDKAGNNRTILSGNFVITG